MTPFGQPGIEMRMESLGDGLLLCGRHGREPDDESKGVERPHGSSLAKNRSRRFASPWQKLPRFRPYRARPRSGAAGELPRFRVHLHFLAFLDEERHADLEAGLERRRLGHAAAGRVAAHARFGGVTASSTIGGNCRPIGRPLNF